MKINWNEKIVDFSDKAIDHEDTLLTVGIFSRTALSSMYEDEKTLSGDDRFKRGLLAKKINDQLGDNPAKLAGRGVKIDDDFTVEEIAMAKECVGKLGSPLIVVQVYEVLEGKSKAETDTSE